MPFKHRFLRIALGFCLLLCACSLEEKERNRDDVDRAEAALSERDIGDAEMYFERYLRKNPGGGKRWEVWTQLLSLALDVRRDKFSAAEYLEIMLVEFAENPVRRRLIQTRLAGLCSDLREYDRAVRLWETLAEDPDTPTEDRALVYRELSLAYLRRLEFSLATDVLDLCLRLDARQETRAACFYALAEARMFTDALPEAEQALRDLLRLSDVSEERRVLAIFMLADVLERQERLPEATEFFESIRESYPNAKVVEVRLAALKNKAR